MKKYSIFLILILLLCLTGCNKKEQPHFEIGFESKIPGNEGDCPFLTGVKSDKRVFDKNDVTMDFYFGYEKNYECQPDEWTDEWNGKDYKYICNATYFYVNGDVVKNYIRNFDDYKNIEGFHLIKEYSREEFLTEDKKATYYRNKYLFLFPGKVEFNYYETLTIPSYLFDSYEDWETERYIYFGVFEVIQELETGKYFFYHNQSGVRFDNYLHLKYEIQKNNTIKILSGLNS